MKPIDDYSCLNLNPPMFFWSGYDPSLKCVVSCSVLVTSAGMVFIDPLPLAEEALELLLQETSASPVAIVLTSGNHQRNSLFLAKKFSIPIYAPVGAGEEIIASIWYEPGNDLRGLSLLGLDSIPLHGFGPGEAALWYSAGKKKILILGDAIINDDHGLSLLPKKYCEDAQLAKKSLRLLNHYAPTIMLFAHGLPLVTEAASRFDALLATEISPLGKTI